MRGSRGSNPDRSVFTDSDREMLKAHGLSETEALRQLGFFHTPPPTRRLVRPCSLGDGILSLDDDWQASLVENFKQVSGDGRVSKFVPASGAASRMFMVTPQELSCVQANLPRFAFASAISKTETIPDFQDALLSPRGLNFAALPKGLIPFHIYGEENRTAFEEHLVEAALYAVDRGGTARIHFTVSKGHEPWFQEHLELKGAALEAKLNARFEVSFSRQSAETDTLAGTAEGKPFRTDDGRLVFRPGGHGALLSNLESWGGDIVVVKNIDNVVPDEQKRDTVHWKQVLIGLAGELEQRIHTVVRALTQSPTDRSLLQEADALIERLRGTSSASAETAIDLLNCPLRVCGVVRNEGEPGGGPFWVEGRAKQIVEGAEVDLKDPGQKKIWASSTHFNPVDLVVCLQDPWGKPYDLRRFMDEGAVFVSKKFYQGRELLALERPGLWNGAMASWNTVFVEVPLTTFAPVKTILDLLRPQHQPTRSD